MHLLASISSSLINFNQRIFSSVLRNCTRTLISISWPCDVQRKYIIQIHILVEIFQNMSDYALVEAKKAEICIRKKLMKYIIFFVKILLKLKYWFWLLLQRNCTIQFWILLDRKGPFYNEAYIIDTDSVFEHKKDHCSCWMQNSSATWQG